MSSPQPVLVARSAVRPSVVTAATRAYLAAAGVALVYAVVVFTQIATVGNAERLAEIANYDTNTEVFDIQASFALLGVGGLIFAALFARCARNIARRAYGARGGAWGITALAVVCLGCSLVITGTTVSHGAFDPGRANIGDALPPWYRIAALALQVVALALTVGGAALLGRPAAGEYLVRPGLSANPVDFGAGGRGGS